MDGEIESLNDMLVQQRPVYFLIALCIFSLLKFISYST